MKRVYLTLLLLSSLCAASTLSPLPVDQAFSFSATLSGNQIILLRWDIAHQYYLYRDRFNFKLLAPEAAQFIKPQLPKGHIKQDDILGKYTVYANELTLPIKITTPNNQTVQLSVTYQGCAEKGYCYPPITHIINADFVNNTINLDQKYTSSQDNITELLKSNHLAIILLAFFGFGLLLAFTPCVLPMIPILSGIILGHHKTITTRKAFRLSATYVLSMSTTYAIAGIIIGLVGANLQAELQQPWVIILFSSIFILLALSMFGLYNLTLPKKFEAFIATLSKHQKGGHYFNVAIMGCLATLIVSPCVTPPLVGVLAYIAKTGDAFLGGIALFSLGLGMGIPLLLIGTAGGKLIPKAGKWMNVTKNIFGIILLGMSIWLLSRIISSSVTMLLWGALCILSAIFMGAFNRCNTNFQRLGKSIGLITFIYGALLMIGGGMGNSNPFKPLSHFPTDTLNAKHIKTIQDFDHALALAKALHKPVMLDFYADWCIACKVIAHKVFPDPQVKSALNSFIVLKADVTANDVKDKALLKYFGVIAPPTFIFFSREGQELKNYRIIGEVSAKQLSEQLQQILIANPESE